MTKRLQVRFLLLLCLSSPMLAAQQEPKRPPLLEVILTTYDVGRTETLVYLRVFADGHAEAHPMRQVDFRKLALRQGEIPSTEFTALREFLLSSKVQHLEPKYERYWGNKDFGQSWEITIVEGETRQSILLENFQPFLARSKKKPYPPELEKLGCFIWDVRTKATGEPLERNYLAGCRELGCTFCFAQNSRYFKADHGVGATYIKLADDGRYEVIDREHMGVFLTDEGWWHQTGAVITFNPERPKKTSYQATENSHEGRVFLAITSANAAAGIVIPADDTKKDLDAEPNHLPEHVLFKIAAKTYNIETKENYPFHYIGKER